MEGVALPVTFFSRLLGYKKNCLRIKRKCQFYFEVFQGRHYNPSEGRGCNDEMERTRLLHNPFISFHELLKFLPDLKGHDVDLINLIG